MATKKCADSGAKKDWSRQELMEIVALGSDAFSLPGSTLDEQQESQEALEVALEEWEQEVDRKMQEVADSNWDQYVNLLKIKKDLSSFVLQEKHDFNQVLSARMRDLMDTLKGL